MTKLSRLASLVALSVLATVMAVEPTNAQTSDTASIVRLVPEPILENLRRDKWAGRPDGTDLVRQVLDEHTLRLTRDGGWLYTPRKYYDFSLEYDMRLESEGRHRVFFRTLQWPDQLYELRFDRRAARVKGQIIAQRWQLPKSTIDVPAALLASVQDVEWFRVELRCQGTSAAVSINGTQVITLAGLDALGGTIGFAGHGVTFRGVELTSAPVGPAIFRTAYVPGGEDPPDMPRVLEEVRPQMPLHAQTKRPKYAVVVEAVIDENGNVAAARFLRRMEDSPEYNEEAMRVVHLWKFTPARLRGRPVPILVTIELLFTWE